MAIAAACVRSLIRANNNPLIGSLTRYSIKSQILFNSNGSIDNVSSTNAKSLVDKLVEQPLSSIESTLDSEELSFSSAFKTHQFSWLALVSQLTSSSLQKANLVIDWRLNKLVSSKEKNQDCYSELIYAFGSCQNVESALRIFPVMEAQGLNPNTSVYNALISACLSSNNVLTALSLFELMEISPENCKCDSDTYNAFISGYAKLGNKKAMEAWYRAKLAAGFVKDAQTFECLISGCVKARNFDDAERYYEEMTIMGFVPTISVVQNMVFVYCKKKNIGKVREHMKYSSFIIDTRIAQMVVDLYYEHGQVKYMEELLDVFEITNQSSEIVRRILHYGIIKMYVKAERLDDVEYSVGRMLRRGISFQDNVDVDNVVCLYFRKAEYERLDLFLKSIKDCYKITKCTYDLLIAGYRRARLQEKIDNVLIEMKSDGFSPF